MKKEKNTPEILQLRIDIEGIRPPIWRRVLIPDSATFKDLHNVIQTAFDWEGYHLHQVIVGQARGFFSTVIGSRKVLEDSSVIPEGTARLREFIFPGGPKIVYIYDFGDDWQHSVKLEKVLPYQEGERYPQCTGGRRMAPAEDCGGIGGYSYLQELVETGDDEERAELEERFGELDFEYFDHNDIVLRALGSGSIGIFDTMREEDEEMKQTGGSGLQQFLENTLSLFEEEEEYSNLLGLGYTASKGLDGLSTEDIDDLTSIDPDLYEDILTYNFETITKEEVEALPTPALLLYLIELYTSNGGTLRLNNDGAYTAKTVGKFLTRMIGGNKELNKKASEEDVLQIMMLHEFLQELDYVAESEDSNVSRLRSHESWKNPSEEQVCKLYRELFIYMIKDFPLTELAGIGEEEYVEFDFIEESIPFSLYLMKRTNHELFSGVSIFNELIKIFPDFSPDWEVKEQENPELFPEIERSESAQYLFSIYMQTVFFEFGFSLGLLETTMPEPPQPHAAEHSVEKMRELLLGTLVSMKYRTTDLFDRVVRWKV